VGAAFSRDSAIHGKTRRFSSYQLAFKKPRETIVLEVHLVRCLESSVTDFGNIFHFRKDRPTALNSNTQIPNSKQYANPNFQNSKQKHSEASALVLHTFLFWSFVFVWSLVIEIWNFRVFGKWVKYGALFPNFKLPFLGTKLMRRGPGRLSENEIVFSRSSRRSRTLSGGRLKL